MKNAHFRITRIGLYFYRPRYTFSFSWGCRWYELLEAGPADCNGGWYIVWGWWMLEQRRWGPCDDWGEEAGDIMMSLVENLVAKPE